ncbi:hypothetical protein MMC31_000263 [Peltigera leucophlebia]|nr:hypothetical protein [Peltigera leucophlebia]
MHSFFHHQFLLLFLSLGSLANPGHDPPPDEALSSQNSPIENGARNPMAASIGRTMNDPIVVSEGCLPQSTSNRVGRSTKLARREAECKNNIQSGDNQPQQLPENELRLPIFDPFTTYDSEDDICPKYPGILYTRPACAEERFATMSPPFSGFYELSRCQPCMYLSHKPILLYQ